MAISDDVLSTTLNLIHKDAMDGLYTRVPLLDHARKSDGIDFEDGGAKIQRPIITNAHSSITEFITGWEPINMTFSDAMQPAIYDWADFGQPIAITKKDELENKGERAVVKILEARYKAVQGNLRRAFEERVLAGVTTSLNGLNTLNGVPAGAGFLEDAAPGSQSHVVGGLSKATYNIPGWQNQYATASSAFGTNGLIAMNAITTAQMANGLNGNKLIIMSDAGYANLKRVLQANERYVDEKAIDGGRMTLTWNGQPVELYANMPANSGVGTNEVTAYFIDFMGLKIVIHSDADFALGEWGPIPGYAARGSMFNCKLQVIADHLGSLGLLIDGDSY